MKNGYGIFQYYKVGAGRLKNCTFHSVISVLSVARAVS